MTLQGSHVLIFGAGYVASHLAAALRKQGATVSLTSRNPDKVAKLKAVGFGAVLFGDPLPEGVTHAVTLIPPGEDRLDPVWETYKDELQSTWGQNLKWFGYTSTTGVYGEYFGNYVTEVSEPNPMSPRSRSRLKIERTYLATALPIHIFRLSGIYGPGRGILQRVKDQQLQNLPVERQPINRIHVADITKTFIASMLSPQAGEVYNVSDDLPAPTIDTIRYAAQVLNKDKFVNNLPNSAPKPKGGMGEGFRMVNNNKIKEQLGVQLDYPTYKEGFRALVGK